MLASSAHRVVAAFAAVAGVIILLGAAGMISTQLGIHDYAFGLIPRFNLDGEYGVPAWFSSGLMVVAALLLFLLAGAARAERDRNARAWLVLSLVFLGLSADETIVFHETLSSPVQNALGHLPLPHFPWVLPAGAFAILVLGLSLRLLRSLPRRTAGLLLLAGAVYVGGALGMELLGGAVAARVGLNALPYVLLTIVEEILEIAGLLLFLFALLDHAGRTYGAIGVRLDATGPATARATGPVLDEALAAQLPKGVGSATVSSGLPGSV